MFSTVELAKQAAINNDKSTCKCIIVFQKDNQFDYVLWNEIKYVWTIIPLGTIPVETSHYALDYDNNNRTFQPYTLTRSGELRATGHGGQIADAIEEIENGSNWDTAMGKLLDK